jgi:hypothetical protein
MLFESFQQIVRACKSNAGKRRIAITAAADLPHTRAIRARIAGISIFSSCPTSFPET